MGFERGVITTLVRRPVLAVEAIRSWLAMRRRGTLKVSGAYLSWRQLTAYGGEKTTMSAQDVVNYLMWRREMRRIRKWEREA
ncbi:MAG TPA: hypothetical protein VK969_13040 [Acidimicrobiia bacterium]|nr:hypothetical protein [Acidimicrobiia bacterium]